MKHFNLLFFLLILGALSCAPCEHFFSYDTKTVRIDILKIKAKKGLKERAINLGSYEKKIVPVEVSNHLMELDMNQYLLCQKIEGLSKNDPDKIIYKKQSIELSLEALRVSLPEQNLSIEPLSEFEFQRIRGVTSGYAVGFIMGRINRFYRKNGYFPNNLDVLGVKDKVENLGQANISYKRYNDDFSLQFSGFDAKMGTPDDVILSKKDLKHK